MKLILLSLLLAAGITVRSQLAISYYPFQSQLSISTNTEKLFWADYRVETNTFFTNLNMELSPMLNVKRTALANYYAGLGVNFNPVYVAADLPVLNGYFLSIGARIKPFEKYRGVQLIFEVSPYVNAQLLSGNLRARLGLAYNFTRKKTK